MGMRGFARAKMHVRCLHETDFTLAPEDRSRTPVLPAARTVPQDQSIGQNRVCFNERSFGPPLHLQVRQDYDYDYGCSCLLLPASRVNPAFCLLSDAAGTHSAQATIGRAPWSLLKTAHPLFPFISIIVPIDHTHPPVDRLTCRGQCLISIHTVATLFHYNSTARRRLSIKLNPPGTGILGLATPRTRPDINDSLLTPRICETESGHTITSTIVTHSLTHSRTHVLTTAGSKI